MNEIYFKEDMRKLCFLMILMTIFMIMPVLSFGQGTTIIGENPQKEKKISYSFINEYGFQVAMPFEKRHFVTGDLIGVFVNSICFNKKQDMIGIGVGLDCFRVAFAFSFPIFVNYRHYFPGKTNLKPLINAALGTKINILGNADLYSTIAGGFKVKAFSFTAGVCVESWGPNFFGGIETKAGYTF